MKILKGIILLIFIILLSCEKKENNSYNINGKISGNFEGYIYLHYENKVDSSQVKNKTFHFEGLIRKPVKATLKPISPKVIEDVGVVSFYLENSNIEININYKVAKTRRGEMKYLQLDSIRGSKTQEIEQEFTKNMSENFYKTDNDSLKHKYLFENLKKLIENHPNSIVRGNKSASINSFFGYLNSVEIGELFKKLDTNSQNKEDLVEIKKIINRRKTLEIGKILENISLPNQNNNLVESKSYRGKYLLLEFWASWCIPCRKTNLSLKKVYDNYKNDDFEILGISIDKNKKDWIIAINEDKLTWNQVIDQDQNTINKLLIDGVPYSILLNKKGEILKRNIKPNDLEIFLKNKK